MVSIPFPLAATDILSPSGGEVLPLSLVVQLPRSAFEFAPVSCVSTLFNRLQRLNILTAQGTCIFLYYLCMQYLNKCNT